MKNLATIDVCVTAKHSGFYHGLLLYKKENSKAGVGIWMNVNVTSEKLSIKKLTGNTIKEINAKIILGEQIIDYSKTVLEPGKYFINLTAVLCETKIIVPPEYAVSSDILNILSEVKDRTYKTPDAITPEIIISGKAIMSSVVIKETSTGFIKKIKQLFFDD